MASKFDTSLFILDCVEVYYIFLIYVDDIIITGNNVVLVQETKNKLNSTFVLKDLGDLNYFLCIEVVRIDDDFHLSQ